MVIANPPSMCWRRSSFNEGYDWSLFTYHVNFSIPLCIWFKNQKGQEFLVCFLSLLQFDIWRRFFLWKKKIQLSACKRKISIFFFIWRKILRILLDVQHKCIHLWTGCAEANFLWGALLNRKKNIPENLLIFEIFTK